MECTLPVTGAHLALLPLALVSIAVGGALVLVTRRAGMKGGAVATALLALMLVGVTSHDADAQTNCPVTGAETTVPPTVEATQVAPSTAAPTTTPTTAATTTSPSTTAATTTIATTTTASTTTSSTTTSTVAAALTAGVTAATTTGLEAAATPAALFPGADLTVSLTGPSGIVIGDVGQPVTMTITNVGVSSTIGPISVRLLALPQGVAAFPTGPTSTDWTPTATASGFLFVSNPSFVLAPNESSTITFDLAATSSGMTGVLALNAVLPFGTGGDVNPTNNSAALLEPLTTPATPLSTTTTQPTTTTTEATTTTAATETTAVPVTTAAP